MKKKVEKMETNGIPVKISVMNRGDSENDSCWVTFDLVDAKVEGTLAEFIIALEAFAKHIAAERGFRFSTTSGWDNFCIFSYRCEFSKINWDEYHG